MLVLLLIMSHLRFRAGMMKLEAMVEAMIVMVVGTIKGEPMQGSNSQEDYKGETPMKTDEAQIPN